MPSRDHSSAPEARGRPGTPPGQSSAGSHSDKANRSEPEELQAIAQRALEIRESILSHPDESRAATAGEVAAVLALVERLAKAFS